MINWISCLSNRDEKLNRLAAELDAMDAEIDRLIRKRQDAGVEARRYLDELDRSSDFYVASQVARNAPRLVLSQGHGDRQNSFGLLVSKSDPVPRICHLYQGYEAPGDGIYWAMSVGVTLKAEYTEEDRREADRIKVEPPIRDGILVVVGNRCFRCRVLGDFSNAAVFDPA